MKLFELALFMLARRAQISAWICRLWVGTDASAACFTDGSSWRFASVPGPARNARFGSKAGFQLATFGASWCLSKPLNFRLKIEVSNMVSRPAGFHRQPLAEPDVRLSPHPAPIKHGAFPYRIASVRRVRHVPGSTGRERATSGLCAP